MSTIRRHVLTGLTAGLGLLLAACSQSAETDTTPEVTPIAAADATVIYLVRHAEKLADAEDPDLTDAGKARAEVLADRLEDAGLTAIYSSDYTRSRDTAAPIAARLGLEVQLYNVRELEAFADQLKTMGGHILVSGHSNTTPRLTDLLGGDYVSPIDEAGEYDRLYIVTLGEDGTASSALERYGAAYTPPGTE